MKLLDFLILVFWGSCSHALFDLTDCCFSWFFWLLGWCVTSILVGDPEYYQRNKDHYIIEGI